MDRPPTVDGTVSPLETYFKNNAGIINITPHIYI